MTKIERIKKVFENTTAYGVAEYDYKHEYATSQEDKESIIESYYELFKLVRDIKEIIDEPIKTKTLEVYQIKLWCNDNFFDEDDWEYKILSDYFENESDAEKELEKYAGKTQSEIEKMCDVCYIGSNRPKIYKDTITITE
jgi:DNA integrity scanning protein DisA with diadenylate cyclase activity